MAKPPSPTRASTGRPGRVSRAAIAAGTPKPMAESPLGINTERGSVACHPCPAMSLCEPTSVARIVPSGAASLAIVTTSDGLSLPAVPPASQAARHRRRLGHERGRALAHRGHHRDALVGDRLHDVDDRLAGV